MWWEVRRWNVWFAVVMLVATLLACGSSVTLLPQTSVAESPTVRVTLTEIDGDILKFLVQNTSPEHMLILRDEVTMQTSQGTLRREPGGMTNVYNVPPYGAEDVNVRFDVSTLPPGEVAQVDFSRAVLLSGRPGNVGSISVQRH